MTLLRCARLAVRGGQSWPLRSGHAGGASRCVEGAMTCGARLPCIRLSFGSPAPTGRTGLRAHFPEESTAHLQWCCFPPTIVVHTCKGALRGPGLTPATYERRGSRCCKFCCELPSSRPHQDNPPRPPQVFNVSITKFMSRSTPPHRRHHGLSLGHRATRPDALQTGCPALERPPPPRRQPERARTSKWFRLARPCCWRGGVPPCVCGARSALTGPLVAVARFCGQFPQLP